MTTEEQVRIVEQELKGYRAAFYTVTLRARVARQAGNNALAEAAQADGEMFQRMIDGFEEELAGLKRPAAEAKR